MKRFWLLMALAMTTCLQLSAADVVKFVVNDGISSGNTKKQIEQNVSALLSELNKAQAENRAINYSGVGITEEAKQQIDMLWMNVHFLCDEPEIVERCLTTSNGLQVRNIPLAVKPMWKSRR